MLSIKFDHGADAAYIRLRDIPYDHGQDLDDSRRIDYGPDNQPVGIELLNVSMGVNVDELPDQTAVGRLLEEHAIRVYA